MKAFMTIDHGSSRLGTMELVLYQESVPVQDFVTLLQRGCKFHRIIPNFMAQGVDLDGGDGTSIYGMEFPDDNFLHSHEQRGMLSMDTNGYQFCITFRPTPHLDETHVGFGHVDLSDSSSAAVLDAMERVATDNNNVPRVPVVISACGLRTENEKATLKQVSNTEEIELEEEEEQPDDEIEDQPKTKQERLRDRLRKLKMKTNQARQLNRQEVVREGERLGSVEGIAKERKRQAKHDKKLRQQEWETRNAKAMQMAAESGVDGKALVEPALESIKKTTRNTEKTEATGYAVNDYYNPEGQHRNYQRNLSSLPEHNNDGVDTSTFDPMITMSTSGKEDAQERQGARRLANELKRRIERKEKNKRKRDEFDATDVGYINQRNKRFNEKISRNYDQHTAEIRQNLERGTAL